jgi:hypothetical protein
MSGAQEFRTTESDELRRTSDSIIEEANELQDLVVAKRRAPAASASIDEEMGTVARRLRASTRREVELGEQAEGRDVKPIDG